MLTSTLPPTLFDNSRILLRDQCVCMQCIMVASIKVLTNNASESHHVIFRRRFCAITYGIAKTSQKTCAFHLILSSTRGIFGHQRGYK